MVNQNLGIRAKVEPEVDKSSQSRMMRDLEKDIEELEELTFESNGIEGRTSPGGGQGSGGGMGAGMAGGAMTRGGGGGLLKGAAGGGMMAGAALLGTVALGGVLANKMYSSMSNASGRLSAVNSILGTAKDLFWKPFGDALANHLLPFAKEALDMAVAFNDLASDKGLDVAIASLASDVESKLGFDDPSITIPTPEDVFGFMEDFEWSDWIDVVKWAAWINPLTWSVYIGDLLWRTYVNSLTWSNFMNALRWLDFVTPLTDWSSFIDFLDDWGPFIGDLAWTRFVDSLTWSNWIDAVSSTSILGMVFGDVSISKSDILGALGVPGYDKPGNGGASSTPRRRSRDPRSTTPTSGGSSTRSRERAAASSSSDIEINHNVEMDSRRVSDGVSRQQAEWFTRS